MTSFRITVRYGTDRQRHHTFEVEAGDIVEALRGAADEMPEAITGDADLVEIRPAPDPDERRYVEAPT